MQDVLNCYKKEITFNISETASFLCIYASYAVSNILHS